MSRETLEWLNTNVLVGFTDKRGKAWHYREGADNHFPGAIPVEEVQRRLFNWTAESRRVAVEVPADIDSATHMADDGTPMRWAIQDDRQAMAASDNGDVFGLFKSGYQPHQYREWLLENVATILDDSLSIGSAGLLRNRAVAWVQVEVPDNIITPEGVEFRPNLLATTSFDGTVATTYKRVITNVVCDNTRDMAMGEAGQMFKAKHSRYSGMKIGAARDALNVIHTMADDFAAEVKTLTSIEVTDAQWSKVLQMLIPTEDEKGNALSKLAITKAEQKREKLTSMYNNDNRCAPWNGTAYGVVQTFNTWHHHERPTRGETNRVERNMEEAIKGGIAKADAEVTKALSLILA